MTIIMQIYLTVLVGLIVLMITSGIMYKIFEDTWHDILENEFGTILLISFILTSGWIVYILLALIWHWY